MEIKSNKENMIIDYNLLSNSKLSFCKNTKAKSIFHYTSIGGLQGILSNKTLRFTNIKYMNDKDEIFAGLDSILKELEPSDENRNKLCSAFMNNGTQTFVCCFSLEDDSLPMWNYYTKEVNNQGYNIEFDNEKLIESILRNNPLLDGCEIAFGNVDYSKDNDSEYSRMIIDGIMLSMKLLISKFLMAVKGGSVKRSSNIDETVLKDLEEKISQYKIKQELSELPICSYNGKNCSFENTTSESFLYFIKRYCFRQEKEFRIVISVPDKQLSKMANAGVYRFRISNGVLIPYLELKFSEKVVKSLTISPTVQSDLVEQSIQDFMHYCDYDIHDFSTFIKRSKVPVRF